ncbi:MAG: hypothetical protein ACI8TA_003639 [Cyclobacteriaceae bacterium]|jgi:hypothetical protein
MKSFDQIRIHFEPSLETFDAIGSILNLEPSEDKLENLNTDIHSSWTYEVIEVKDAPHFDFINKFCDLLEGKFDKLYDLGINRNDITFWYLYEYEGQCNLEFNPKDLKRLGDNGITLCISCWDGGID